MVSHLQKHWQDQEQVQLYPGATTGNGFINLIEDIYIYILI